jgi:type I restriction enzyme S subunit
LKLLSDICDVRDGTHNSPKYVKEGIPFVTQKNIREDGLNFYNVKLIKYEDHSMYYKRSNVAYGDILISMIGANRGMSAIVDDKRIFSIKNVCLVKKGNKANQNYLLYYFKSKQAQDYMKLFSKGGAQDFISLTVLRKFPILVPSKEMQEQILEKFTSIYSLTKLIKQKNNEKLSLIKKLKQSILYKAFNRDLVKAA